MAGDELLENAPDAPTAPDAPDALPIWSPRLSAEQLRFYFLHQMNPRDPDIHICRTLRITGRLDPELLRRSVAELARRHDILRSIYRAASAPPADGQPRISLREDAGAAFSAVDLSRLPHDERAARAEAIVSSELRIEAPFDLETGPLFRVTAIELGLGLGLDLGLGRDAAEHVVVLRFHHIIADGASVRLFLNGLWETYTGLLHGQLPEPPPEPAIEPPPDRRPLQFRDFIEWEHRRLTGEAGAKLRAYWASRLARPTPLDLAIARRRPERHTRAAGTVHTSLGTHLKASLRALCQAERVTPYMVMLSILQLLLHQVTGERDVLVGTPVAARQRRELQSMLGVLVSWIAMRGQVRPERSFMELLLEARAELPSAYVHQCSYEALLSAAGNIPRDPSRSPLFQVTLNYARYEALPAPVDLLIELDPIELHQTPYDLSLRFEEIGDTCSLGLTYYEGAMERGTAERLCAAFLALAEHCLAHPHQPLSSAPSLQLGLSAAATPSALAALPAVAASTPAALASLTGLAPADRQVVIAATFTAEPVRPALELWLDRLDLRSELAFAPFNQVFQELIDLDGLIARNRLGSNVLLVRFEDWKDSGTAVEEFARLLAAHAERSPAHTLVVVCPPSAAQRSGEPLREHGRLAGIIAAAAEASARTHVLRWEELLARYPVDVIDDPESDAYARAPYSVDFNVALGTAVARKLNAMLRPAPKVLVLDCDNTLWRGVVGEDGPQGLVIDEGHRALQQFAAEQLRAGVLLCLASKNNEADVWEAFEATPGMVLRRDMIVAHRIDWEPKSKNLHALAAELNLGVDSFVFLDDSPAEHAEVRAGCPAALALQLPARSAELPRFLDHLWMLDPRKLTSTDRARTALYAANARREQLRSETSDLQQFVASLEVKTTFAPLSRATLARASQLTQRTNQFNTTTLRRSEAELAALGEAGHEHLIVDVSDRFGDYGLVGLVSYQRGGEALEISALLLSCRALGRGVEHRVLAELGGIAQAAGLERIEVAYRPTAKNQPAHRFLEAVARPHRVAAAEEGSFTYRIPVAEALTAPDRLAASEERDGGEAGEIRETADATAADATAAEALHELWRTIPAELDTVPKIRRALAASLTRARSGAAHGAFVAPRDELERTIARAWCEAILVEEIGVHDDYFAVGGDSIRSLAVVSQLRQAGLPVTVLELHEHPTVARLAELLRSRGAPASASSLAPASSSSSSSSSGQLRDALPDPAGPGAAGTPYPLSFSQRYVLAAYARHNLRPDAPPTGVFHTQDRISVREPRRRSSMACLRRAVEGLVRRTATLRTRILPGAAGWQQVELPAYPEVLEVVELSRLDPGQQEAKIAQLLLEDRMRPFDPERSGAAMIRCYAAVTGESSFELIVATHHGFCDGWSLQAAYNQLFALYEAHQAGDDARVVELDRALAENDGWFRELVHREQTAPGASPPGEPWWTQLASRWPTPVQEARSVAARGAQQTLIDPDGWTLVAAAGERAKASHTSLKAVLLDAFAGALARQLDPRAPRVIAVVTNGRKDDLTRPMDVFGLCWTLVPIVFPVERDPRLQLAALHRELLATEAHARHPVEAMFQGAEPEAVACASFNFTSFHNASWRSGTPGLQLLKRESFHRFPFPLDFNVRLDEPARSAALKVSWSEGAFDERSARALLDDFSERLGHPTAGHRPRGG